jgi:hypothetical protein
VFARRIVPSAPTQCNGIEPFSKKSSSASSVLLSDGRGLIGFFIGATQE